MASCPSCGRDNPEGFRFCGFCSAPLAGPGAAHEQRKTVTVLFCDVVGSTALGESTDPEALRTLLGRYFEKMKGVVERHGGSVEKFIGDAVMAVFGVPVVHEDDALRACRAATEMRDAFPGLGVAGRIGLATGEVVTGTEERLATGDALNVAARLQQAAQPNEILIGAETLALARGAVDVTVLEPLVLKGKAQPVQAYRLLGLTELPERRRGPQFVGRRQELRTITDEWKSASQEARCELVTIVGEAGVGKSRLVGEFLSSVGGSRVVRGRCLPYGEGITYWPVVEVIKQLDALPTDPTAAAAIRSLLGESASLASADEIAVAFRRLLEEQAPLVCVFDDIQWGEETFLDLVEHVALLSSGAPILLLCLARPELIERRPTWPLRLRLEPLPDADVTILIGEQVPADLGERIAHAAGGNPLFVSEILAMAAHGEGVLTVPPTLRSLLAARLDQLESSERRVLERGAVEGEVFHRGAVQALAPEEEQVTPRLAGLVRKELIRPERAQIVGDDGFRFRHLLIRDAAYEGLGKSARAQLHERFARWLEGHGRDLVELDEILGYHLEQAARYRKELGQADSGVTNAAVERLAAAAGRAFGRSDFTASSSLMTRAVELLPADDSRRSALLVDLAEAARECGRYSEAGAALREVAGSGDDPRARRLATIALFRLGLDTDAEIDFEAAEAAGRDAAEVAERERDDVAGAAAWRLLWHVDAYRCRFAAASQAARRAAAHALRSGDPRWGFDRRLELSAAARGSSPTSAVIARGEEVLAELRGQDRIGSGIRWNLGLARAMRGEFAVARELMLQAIGAGGGQVDSYTIGGEGLGWQIAAQQGDWTTAERELRRGYDGLLALGANAVAASIAGLFATSLCLLGRFDEAEGLAVVTVTSGAKDDVTAQAFARAARARVLAARGEAPAAVQLAEEATALMKSTDALADIGYVDEVLAEMLQAAGRSGEAQAAAEDALCAYERKEHLVGSERVRRLLARLQAAPSEV